jgi:hypothetical protein
VRRLLPLIMVVLLTGDAIVRADAFASFEAARDLVSVLDQLNLHTIATVDPAEPGAFVAALYIPRVQLLVVHARHPSAEEALQRLAMHQYLELYSELLGTQTRDRFFVRDAGGDGILSALAGSGDVDVVDENGRRTLVNGDAKGQHLTAAEYDAGVVAADAKYARLLALLTSAVHQMRAQPRASTSPAHADGLAPSPDNLHRAGSISRNARGDGPEKSLPERAVSM